jgi:hypothetical protein
MTKLLDLSWCLVEFDTCCTHRTGYPAGTVKEWRGDAEDTLNVLLVIDRVPASAGCIQIQFEVGCGRDRLSGPAWQTSLGDECRYFRCAHLREDRLAG